MTRPWSCSPDNPRVIITNGLMVGLYDNQEDWEIAAQMGVSSYGQMTAGGWMYIGPQGIVHGTYNTLLNAGRKMCWVPAHGDLAGLLFVSSGLGGMSGAQPKAAKIAGAVSITAEVDYSRIKTRHSQGWVDVVTDDLERVYATAKSAKNADQTSCNVAYDGGYCPCGSSFEERTRLLARDRENSRNWWTKALSAIIAQSRPSQPRAPTFLTMGMLFSRRCLMPV